MGGGGISQVWGGGHQSSMGGPSAKYGGGHQPTMGGASAKYGGGGGIFPPVCTLSQNPENYFSNTYVLPSVNRTAGPISRATKFVCILVNQYLVRLLPLNVSFYLQWLQCKGGVDLSHRRNVTSQSSRRRVVQVISQLR